MAWGRRDVPERVMEALARGGTVLTASYRSAHRIRGAMEPSRLPPPQGRQPKVYSWQAWTSGLWHRALLGGETDRMLLNRSQEEAIWLDLIGQDAAVASLRSPSALARLASEAYRGVVQHRGLSRLPGSASNADTEAFVRLAAGFEERCRRQGYLAQARLEGALRRIVQSGGLAKVETRLTVYGLGRMVPARRALLEAFEQAGVAVEEAADDGERGAGMLYVAEDEGREMRDAALWARGLLREQPHASIGILLPTLGRDARYGGDVSRVLREVLAPETAGVQGESASLPYEISCACSVGSTAAVADALDLLALAAGPLPLERAGSLLLSVNLAGGAELGARAEFDAFELRRARLLRPEMTLDGLIRLASRSGRRGRLTRLLEVLRAVQGVVRRQFGRNERKPWADWAREVRELLKAAGWTSDASGGGLETGRAWESVLDELATLDFEGGRVSFEEALDKLRRLTEETQREEPPRGAAVQVMTPEEAEGMRFDAVWFGGAGDLTWPAPAGGSPLLSWPLRRELGLPGSDHAAELAEARRVAERVAGSAETVVFSYAREIEAGRQRRSPGLGGLGLEPMMPAWEDGERALVELEAVADDGRIAHPPEGPVRGGAAVLQMQAACGFRAFAHYRLFANELEGREPGMNARERGDSVHRVLERFWETVRKQETLRGMSMEERDARLGESVEWAMAEAQTEAEGDWDEAYLKAQRRRLMTLGRRWLAEEMKRTMPFTVVQRETKVEDVTIGPLHLTLRVDRIDETERGAVLIDYKTGKAETANWTGQRPDQPQLPLYAVLAGEAGPVHAVAFGKVQAGKELGLVGFDNGDGGTLKKGGTPPAGSLDAQLEEWREVLTGLATEFWNGESRVDPKVYPTTCNYCAQRVLCRLDSASLMEEDEEDVEETDLDEAG